LTLLDRDLPFVYREDKLRKEQARLLPIEPLDYFDKNEL